MKKAIIFFVIFLSGYIAIGQVKPAGIDITEIINIGGIKQVFSIKGKEYGMPLNLVVGSTTGNLPDEPCTRLFRHFYYLCAFHN
ncbi:hypothetical protein [Mucilaginibacter ginsenosidivorax]|uniref:Uncharacterized protein n=1 Tax=Mucilaginibacter ginsenosidivorax TaxID=862126 RepID=A0A5B8VUW4_9SPHI|nr:hypothetical protein [Mucilaginibacter ginsenosidivorax]QEC75219.1 hypothetical protein FSB76_04415 [Mucilaginibacter ginsenosidivorax]